MCGGCGVLQGGTKVIPRALLLLLARRRRRAALDGLNTPWSPNFNKKGLKQQSTSRKGRVGAAGGRSGVYEYTKL